MHLFTSELEVKKFELLPELLPGARLIAMVTNPIIRAQSRTHRTCRRRPK
jgi:hypothetical protein